MPQKSAKRQKVVNPSKILKMVPEIQTVDAIATVATTTLYATAPYFHLCNATEIGSTAQGRSGNRIRPVSVEVIYYVQNSGSAVTQDAGDVLKCDLVFDRQANGAVPGIADIFQARKFDGSAISPPNSEMPFNIINKDRFQILRSKKHRLPAILTNGAESTKVTKYVTEGFKVVKVYKKFPASGYEMFYKADNGDIGDIATGSLHAVFQLDSQPQQADWSLLIRSRFRFVNF